MNAFVSSRTPERPDAMSVADVVARAALAAVSVAAFVFAHELVHLFVGRLAGIPAAFTGLTSVGIPRADVHLYAEWRLALMNAGAPLFTVLTGFAALAVLPRLGRFPRWVRYFLSWWAIFGIPYLGLQAMIVVASVDFSGNGADSAAVAGYFHAGPLALAVVSTVGFLYFMGSSRWVVRAIQLVEDDGVHAAPCGAAVAPWRRFGGWLLVFIAIAAAVRFSALAYGVMPLPLPVLTVFACWSVACALRTRWRSPAARRVWGGWLIPGAIGMFALVPLGFVGGGNDFAELWAFEMAPVFAATMLASRMPRPAIAPFAIRS